MINASFWVYNLQLQRGIHGPKPVDPGPSGSVLVLGPDRSRTSKIKKSRTEPDWDQTGLGPTKF